MLVAEKRKLAYRETGAGFPLVLGHSFLWNADMWTPQAANFKKTFTVLLQKYGGMGCPQYWLSHNTL